VAAAAELAALTAALFALRGEIPEARRMLDAARARGADDGRRGPPPATIADLVDAVDAVPADPASPVTAAATGGDRSPGEALIESEIACLRERYADAHRLAGYVLARAAEPMWRELAAFQRARAAIRSGRFHEARVAVAEWAAQPAAQSTWVSRWVVRAWGEFADGRPAEAAGLLAQAVVLNQRHRAAEAAASPHALRGQLALATGDLQLALQELTTADLVSAPLGNPSLVRHLPDLVEVLARLGRGAEAADVLARLAAGAAAHPTRWAELALARCRAIVAPAEAAIAAFDEAVSRFGVGDSDFELALTLGARAWRLAGLGVRSSAELAVAEASAQFAVAGAEAWTGRIAAAAPARPDAVPDARLSLLTPGEREIALLVAEGLRNKEIATRLYVSVRTVELRLTTIYRKLGARSRSHLAAMLA
jgi:DNA-binding CsgD family transcriptional regulator